MKRSLIFTVGIVLVLVFAAAILIPKSTASEEIGKTEIFTNFVSMEDAVSSAESSGKKILIDVYTEWCGFCRRMNTETYADPKVRKALNEYYHVVRLDAESTDKIIFQKTELTKQEFAQSFGIYSFPTTVFLESNSVPFATQPGFIEAETFHKLLVYVGTEAYKFTPFDEFEIK